MNIRDRIKELRRVKAGELAPNPLNWRTHPKEQADALRGLLAEVGFAGAVLAREQADGTLQLIDGHLRAETVGHDTEIPVLVLDVTEAEAAKILATYDPLGAMAGADDGKLAALLADIEAGDPSLRALLESITPDLSEGRLVPVDGLPPPKMTWALVGIPTVRFGEIAGVIESLASVEGVVCETTSNNG